MKGAANPVNVKKVLVIGSGGLSIGQAGEFDYSGMYILLVYESLGEAGLGLSTDHAIQGSRVKTS